ncbi:DEKNAAC102134 [Brettanomyces naardenensis]|uniref:DEKNAAC102134 n=1 Tax=Brettanomyces naardenensis TaxID=13370 RepID=A0A448YJU9_BRENA|nr:DEKNAAC102134 [Brettanomyces naardenensis]
MSETSDSPIKSESASNVTPDASNPENSNPVYTTSSPSAPSLPHTIMTTGEKYFLAGLISLFALCSGLNTPIYWVALPEMEDQFNINEEQANLTVTVYLVFQAISPLFFCTLADFVGRRPVVLYCMLGCVGSNIGLAVCNSYGVLMFLRCLLAIHGAPFAAISSAIVGDFTTRKDRGGLIGVTSGFALIGVGIAPFIGSCLDERWKWRGIFWFSAAFNCLALALAVFFYPETRRTIVGNMGIAPVKWMHKSPVIYLLNRGRISKEENGTREEQTDTSYNPLRTLNLLRDPMVLFALLPNSLLNAAWTMGQASLTTALSQDYGYPPLKVGLCYFSSGVACCVSTVMSGKLLNYSYKKARQSQQDLERSSRKPLNIIRIRFRYFQIFNTVALIFTVIYGWSLDRHWPIAAILVCSFIMTYAVMYPQMAAGTVLVDLYPERSGAVSSLNNLSRCAMSAIFVSCLSLMNNKMTIGGTYSFMGGLSVLCGLSMIVAVRYSDKLLRLRGEKEKEGQADGEKAEELKEAGET